VQGWPTLTVLLEVCSRTIVGWATAAHLRTELSLAALRDRRPPPGMLSHHTDSGSQYLSAEYSRFPRRPALAERPARRRSPP
jgi:transposase InsO family protein